MIRLLRSGIVATTILLPAIVYSMAARAQVDPIIRNLMQAVPSMGLQQPQPSPFGRPPGQLQAPPQPQAVPFRNQPSQAQPQAVPWSNHPSQAQAPLRAYPAATPPDQPASGPSFSCARASLPAEFAICRSHDLSLLDRQLTATYGAALSQSGTHRSELIAAQRAWQSRRNSCGSDDVCLQQAMATRISELAAAGGTDPATRAPASIAVSPSRTGALPVYPVPAAAPNAGAVQTDPLEVLVHPPPGLRPWPIDSVAGHLEVSFRNHHPYATTTEAQLGDRFFRLLALAAAPNRFDIDNNIAFLAGLLDDDAHRIVFGSARYGDTNRWAGSNEIEHAASRARLTSQYFPLIVASAPKTPFVFHWSEFARLRDYDATRRGFSVQPTAGTPLGLLQSLQTGGLKVGPGMTPIPDLFWPVPPDEAEAFLRRNPHRDVELAATVAVNRIDPTGGEVSLSLQTLSLREPGGATPLLAYRLAPSGPVENTASATTPAPADEATANAVDAASHWHLPMFAGLARLDWADTRRESLSEQPVPGGYPAPRASVPKSNELWSRAIQALALASQNDPAAVPDGDVPRVACVLLSPVRQTELFRKPGCQPPSGAADSPFVLKDGAAAFRAQDLPDILKSAPHLPLRLLLVRDMPVGSYDVAHHRFPLLVSSEKALKLFGSEADAAFPEYWPVDEAEARRFVASQAGRSGSKVWLAVTVTMTGTTPEQGVQAVSWQSGLRNKSRWRLRTDSMGLYLDEALTVRLHDFTPELVREPQPVIGTAAEQSPPPSPVPLSDEGVLLLVLHHMPQLPPDLPIKWEDAAGARFRFERFVSQQNAWQSETDPWGVFFADEPTAATTDAYRMWTMRRAAVVQDRVVLTRAISGPYNGQARRDIPVLGPAGFNFLSGSQNFTPPGGEVARQLAAKGIDPSQLVPIQVALSGNSMVPVYVAVPNRADGYIVPDLTIPAGDSENREQAVARIGAEVVGVETVKADGRYAVLLKIVPTRVEVRRGSAIITDVALTGPDFAAAQAARSAAAVAAASAQQQQQESAAQHRADAESSRAKADEDAVRAPVRAILDGTTEGPEILGLKLGMDVPEAERLIRAHMTVARVISARGTYNAEREFGPVRIFVNADLTEQIGLVDRGTGRVLGVTRVVLVDKALTDDALLATLQAKYGPPKSPKQWDWGQGHGVLCEMRGQSVSKFEVTEGAPPATGKWPPERLVLDEGAGLLASGIVNHTPTFADFRECGPRLTIVHQNALLRELLYDARIYGVLTIDATKAATTAAALPKL